MGFQNLEAGTRQLQGPPTPEKKNPHEDEEQLLEKRHSGHISAARVAIPPRPTPGFKEFRGDNVLPRASYSDKNQKKRKELSAATDTVLLQQCMLCNNAKRIGMGEPYMGGAWGGYHSSSCHQGNWGGIAL